MRLIDADALMEQVRLAEISMEKHGREFASCFLAPSQEVSTEWWYVEELIYDAPSIEEQPRWIPCSERLPAEDEDVLISYRYKEGEGDASHINVDITSYGQMYFGGNKVGDYKHWRSPFDYFESNYEVIAWMPLPEPYKEMRQDADN